MMELSSNHLILSSSFFLAYFEVVILLSCFNLRGLNLLGLATPVVFGNDTDQQALLQFRAKITSDQLRVMNSWNSSIHFCQWYGVTCGRRHQRVTGLKLQFQKLGGSISPYLGNLSFLRELNLEGNNFNNKIPQEIGRLRRLEILQLANNSINGEIPSNLSGCSKLTFVNMRGNQVTGEIPRLLGPLSNLKFLSFANNSLRGSIPPSLGNLSSLENLVLGGNLLSGTLPEALAQLKNLLIFSASINAISGIVPISIFNLSNLIVFDIGVNKIQGTLPSDLGITMPYIEIFSVTNNQITGQFPISLSNASNLMQFQGSKNKFTGNLPSFEKLDKLSRLRMYKNNFGNGRASDLNFLCSLTNATKLEYLDIGENNFGGILPECISNLSSSILSIVIRLNKIRGRIPAGIENLINLEMLVVSLNQLSGSIPLGIGRLQKLKMFYADNNFLSGAIPPSSGNLTMLIELALNDNNLQGNIPSNLGKCENLVALYLSDNNLSGSMPTEVIGLSSLSIALDLSSNYLTGVLPVEVENLKHLGSLFVSQNRLSGLLPNNLGSCVSLENLFLDGNLFEGPIPSSLSSLRGLTSLDISDNNLTGDIPEFLVSFGSLRYLNLSFNDFEGMIPVEGVFKNATATFVEGNNKLCGGIPELHLSRCSLKTSIKRSNTSLKLKIAIAFVILGVIFVSSFLLILWFRKKKEQPTTTCSEDSLLHLSYQSILRATGGLSTQNLVGLGSFGSVYKGDFEESGVVLAVKVLNLQNHRASRSFLAECEALKNIRHRNLVKVLTAISGVDYQGNDFKALVYEFMLNGSLEDWLHPSVGMNEPKTMRNLNFSQRVNVVVDVAHALEYLHHHCETPIIHCDLKPSNILLDEEMVGHISDFGLAKILSADRPINNSTNQSSSLGLRGTVGYASPEYGMGSELSTKGDVYSYGILLLEMFTGKRPTNEMFKEGFSLHNFVMAALPERVIEIIDPILLQENVRGGTIANITLNENSLGNDIHLQYLNSIFEIGLTCSAESPSERMDMSDVVSKLCSIRDKLHPTRLHSEGQLDILLIQPLGKANLFAAIVIMLGFESGSDYISNAGSDISMAINGCFILLKLGLNLLGLATPVVFGNDTDQQALLQFRAKITGDQLRVMNSWNSSIHFCQWELNLEGNNFNNKIPQEIGRLRRLEILQLANNSINGEIPSNLSRCSKLTFVNMRSNQVTGEIPGFLGLLSNLKFLSFANNSLRGSIPHSLGNLSSLEQLILGGNLLSGTLPEALGQLKNLLFFSASVNAISGIVPISIFNLSNMIVFDIGLNKIQGTLPSYLGISMPYIEIFSVTQNQITGQFPISLSNASNLMVLQVSKNKLTGNLPSFEKLDKLSRFRIYKNNFGNGRASDLNFLCSLTNATKLEYLDIGENNFGGTLPECISNLSSSISSIVIGLNKIRGRIPTGIENLINLELLEVSLNQLSGSIPLVIGRLQKLKMFYAHSNFLSGAIPHSIGNLTMLTQLALYNNNLQGNIPSSLGKCENLVALYLSDNNLSGSMPNEVIGLSSLSIALDLSSNYLTGVLPVEVENLKNLGSLFVSQNRLFGLLPNNLGSCVSLENLFLDGNLFEGPIPSSLSSLRGLTSLDISDNNLTGDIPEFFVSFGSLRYLNLSFNDFEGMIPVEGVFKNATATFVEGNNKLCGGIPELHLSRCSLKTSIKRSNTSLKLKIAIAFVILGVIFVSSFLLILWFRKKKEQPTTTCSEDSLLHLSYQSILRATGGLSTQNLVGLGSFGSVYKGDFEESGVVLAVKVLNLQNHRASRSFLAECEALKNIRHRNLVKVLTAISGVDYQGNDFKALVYEFMVNGSLEDWLHPSVGMNEPETMRNLNFSQRVNVVVDVAHALEYLHHHCETPIIHCDLKPSNILLDEEMVGHISDFGLAKILSADRPINNSTNQSSSLGLRGTVGYAPPGKYTLFMSSILILFYYHNTIQKQNI
ncbi:hypothetical protein REPUB_Repub03eG0226400 [Reevesia pubescens]